MLSVHTRPEALKDCSVLDGDGLEWTLCLTVEIKLRFKCLRGSVEAAWNSSPPQREITSLDSWTTAIWISFHLKSLETKDRLCITLIFYYSALQLFGLVWSFSQPSTTGEVGSEASGNICMALLTSAAISITSAK